MIFCMPIMTGNRIQLIIGDPGDILILIADGWSRRTFWFGLGFCFP